ncbi:MAG: pectinesterase, partial [Lachnospiraceae bacterium]|nr:pectinesterase [Lachnospiraceae bacterium]
DGNGNGSGSGDGDGNGSGSGDGDGSGSGSGDGDGNGSGSGDGDGNGSGSGDGDGSGSGSGDSDGSGSGRGTGSGTKVHDYVSVPNAIGDDDALTGNKNGDQESDYYRQQNGLAWEGEHVDYNSVIGQYTDNAYEGITNNRYPSGMESVIRDYFENLNK